MEALKAGNNGKSSYPVTRSLRFHKSRLILPNRNKKKGCLLVMDLGHGKNVVDSSSLFIQQANLMNQLFLMNILRLFNYF